MKLVLTSLACLIGLTSAQLGADNCNRAQFLMCNGGLGSFWGIDTTTAWKDPSDLQRIITTILERSASVDSIVAVCNGFSEFYSCLGQEQIRNCLGLIGQMGYGLDVEQAYQMSSFRADWDFRCGAGFWTLYESKNMAKCAVQTYTNYQKDTGDALRKFYQAAHFNPDNACSEAQTLMDSWRKIYATGPCKTVDESQAGWFGCTSAREWVNAEYRHCKHVTTCATPTA